MPTRFWIRVVVWLSVPVAVLIAAVQSLILGHGLALNTTTLTLLLGVISAVGVVGASLDWFDRLLWRLEPFSAISWPGKPPLLRGTWRMELTVDKLSRDAAPREDPACYYVIRQTASQTDLGQGANGRRVLAVSESDR